MLSNFYVHNGYTVRGAPAVIWEVEEDKLNSHSSSKITRVAGYIRLYPEDDCGGWKLADGKVLSLTAVFRTAYKLDDVEPLLTMPKETLLIVSGEIDAYGKDEEGNLISKMMLEEWVVAPEGMKEPTIASMEVSDIAEFFAISGVALV